MAVFKIQSFFNRLLTWGDLEQFVQAYRKKQLVRKACFIGFINRAKMQWRKVLLFGLFFSSLGRIFFWKLLP
jgi:hypothetical protein